MKLADWLHRNHLTPGQLRSMLGVKSRTTVNRYLSGERTPREDVLRRIEAITGGAVTRADFDSNDPPECAEVVQESDGSHRYVFPWSRDAEGQDNVFKKMLTEPGEWDRLTNPVSIAIRVLSPRAKVSKRGGFLLDGRRTDAKRIVQAANAVFIARGEPTIDYPGLQKPDEGDRR